MGVDIIVIFLHWSAGCSKTLKFWILGKYIMPLLSYLSFLFFIPCTISETVEASTTLPYSQQELRAMRLRQTKYNLTNQLHINLSDQHLCCCQRYCCSCPPDLPYPYDIMLGEWIDSPSTVIARIIGLIEGRDGLCKQIKKTWVSLIGIIFDRGVLEFAWLIIGILTVWGEDKMCCAHHPVLYYYVSLQVILGIFLIFLLLVWLMTTTICPLQVMFC